MTVPSANNSASARPSVHGVSRWSIVRVAWPIILANIANPLLGLVDTAVIGNLGDAALLGGIAIGAMVFSFLFWGFGFLRMGTTGLVAQARGAGDEAEAKAAFYRAFLLGISIGLLLIVLQNFLADLALMLIDGSPQVERAALVYYQIRIWAAPLTLANLAVIGFLLGVRETRAILTIQILLNASNILLDVLFVVFFGWGVAGIAAGTVIAEALALLAGVLFVMGRLRSAVGWRTSWPQMMNAEALRLMFAVNRDLMIRTLSLIFGFAWFTNSGARSGDVVLAANAILMQFVSFAAFFLDGFALAVESLVGYAIGARNRLLLDDTMTYAIQLCSATAVLLSAGIALTGGLLIDVLTNIEAVRQTAGNYLGWVIAAPVIAVWAYLLDGVFIGATRTREMRNAMLISLVVYLGSWHLLLDYGNHGLWLALMLYFAARALTLAAFYPAVRGAAA